MNLQLINQKLNYFTQVEIKEIKVTSSYFMKFEQSMLLKENKNGILKKKFYKYKR